PRACREALAGHASLRSPLSSHALVKAPVSGTVHLSLFGRTMWRARCRGHVLAGEVAVEDSTRQLQSFEGRSVERDAFALQVGSSGAADVGPLVPVEAQPAQFYQVAL